MKIKNHHFCILAVLALATFTVQARDSDDAGDVASTDVARDNRAVSVSDVSPPDPPGSEMTARGHNLRGVYMPVGRVKTLSAIEMLHELRTIGANAVVIDVKDDFGRVTFTNRLPLARGYPHGYQFGMKKMIKKLQNHGIYVIARLVCFKDNWFATRFSSVAVKDVSTGGKWHDLHHQKWVDPHSQKMRDHIVSVAQASEALGVDEIQLDYVRFPVETSARNARYPEKRGNVKRYEMIAELLRQVDAAISIPLSIDVFGLTAYHPEESEKLGQYLEHLGPYIDAISPMVYLANWPSTYWENPKPEKTHQVIKGACIRIRERLGKDILVRPLLQGFRWRAENWGYSFVKNQIDAAMNGGASGYIFWNAKGKYRQLRAVWADMDREAAAREAAADGTENSKVHNKQDIPQPSTVEDTEINP
jgi:hypothetical protein